MDGKVSVGPGRAREDHIGKTAILDRKRRRWRKVFLGYCDIYENREGRTSLVASWREDRARSRRSQRSRRGVRQWTTVWNPMESAVPARCEQRIKTGNESTGNQG